MGLHLISRIVEFSILSVKFWYSEQEILTQRRKDSKPQSRKAFSWCLCTLAPLR
jgi:hypothetical protein